ncbi:hypothetical protein CcCBS67573_g01436 [Chytriomyces confervae]|uniref:Pentacotripeptide-repeat region of PRORP domain-containing protein n=1 Tax=Chytriomyces confervae TaxID=246404 RepID=A0A507FQG3_9FUNG|nr:hypothetical protein HDU80_003874 [Chytriomyces hyalinus]TPX77277.1 hypothetical protein CcCBS67573_g01436 [Chytriomyces confervae]
MLCRVNAIRAAAAFGANRACIRRHQYRLASTGGRAFQFVVPPPTPTPPPPSKTMVTGPGALTKVLSVMFREWEESNGPNAVGGKGLDGSARNRAGRLTDYSSGASNGYHVDPPQLVSLLRAAPLTEINSISSLGWSWLGTFLCRDPYKASIADYERLLFLADLISSVIERPRFHGQADLIKNVFVAAVASKSVTTKKSVDVLIQKIRHWNVNVERINAIVNEMALLLAKQGDPILAWHAVQLAGTVCTEIRNVTGRMPGSPRLHKKVCQEILNAFSFVSFSNPEKCADCRAIIKSMISVMEEDGQYIGDYPLNMLARLSSDGSTWEKPCPPIAVYEFLDWIKAVRPGYQMTSIASTYLVFHALRGRDTRLAEQLLETSDFVISNDASMRSILIELAKIDRMDLANRIFARYQELNPTKIEEISHWKEVYLQSWLMSDAASMDERILFLENCTKDEQKAWSFDACKFIITFCLKAKLPQKAVELYQRMKELPEAVVALNTTSERSTQSKEVYRALESSFNNILYGLAKIGNFREVMKLYRHDTAKFNFRITQETCTVLISSFSYIHPVEGSRFLDNFESYGSTGDVQLYTSLINGLTRAGRLDQAIELLHRMKSKGVEPNTNTFNTIIHGLCSAGKLNPAMDFLTVMDEAQCPPDTGTFNILAHAFFKRSRWQDAQNVLTAMEDRGIPWDIVTFNTLINAHIRREGGNFEEAERLFELMQNPPYNFNPSSITYDAQLYKFVMEKDWKGAIALLDRMYPSTLNHLGNHGESSMSSQSMAKSVKIILDGLCRNDRLEEAKQLFKRFKENKNFTHGQDHSGNIGAMRVSLMKGCARAGDLKGCREILKEHIEFEAFASDSMNAAMITAYMTCGDLEGAVKWAEEVLPGAGSGMATLATIRGWGSLYADKSSKSEAGKQNATAPAKSVGAKSKADAFSEELVTGNRRASVDGNWTGAVVFGRGSSYSLMLVHAKSGNLALMEAVHAQLLRLESWGFSNCTEIKQRGARYSTTEANVLIQCYGALLNGSKALAVWRDSYSFKPATLSAAPSSSTASPSAPSVSTAARNNPFSVPRGPSALSSQGLADIYGVDRITVSNILDALSFSRMDSELDSVWNTLLHAEFPMDLNNYISYAESLARRGDGDGCARFIETTVLDGDHGHVMESKVFWTAIGILKNGGAAQREAAKRIWQLMKARYPTFEDEVNRKTGVSFR